MQVFRLDTKQKIWRCIPLAVRQQKILRTPGLYHINGDVITLMFSGLFMCPGETRLYVIKHGNVTEANLSRNWSGVSSL